MAWAPSTNFEDELVSYQPDYNMIQGQLAYEAMRKNEYTPRPSLTYEYLSKREARNRQIEESNGSKSKEISSSLAMMEHIQQIAGTKPLGEHATLADLEDTSTVEHEAIALMRHYGMKSMAAPLMGPPRDDHLPKDKVYIMQNGKHKIPWILDPAYFEPGKLRKKPMAKDNITATTVSSGAEDLNESTSSESQYDTAKSNLEDSTDNNDDDTDQSYVEIPYKPLTEEVE